MAIASCFLGYARQPILRAPARLSVRRFSLTPVRLSGQDPIGVKAALRAKTDPSFTPRPAIFKEFDLTGRVAVVSGANRGLGLEIAQALAEAGATVHCFDLSSTPSDTWKASAEYIERLELPTARLQYASLDVTDQSATWEAVEAAASVSENRVDICAAVAGVIHSSSCLDYSAADFTKVTNVNINGVLYFAQAAARQMAKCHRGGSIILMASAAGSVSTIGTTVLAYCTSKGAVLQMARTMACELGPQKIRVNSLSPGYIRTGLTSLFLDGQPQIETAWSSQNPLGRLGMPEEIRGAAVWLASDASTYCTGSDILVCGGHTAW